MEMSYWLDISFVLLSIVLLVVYLGVWRRLSSYQNMILFEKKELPFLSVIICAKNERLNLENHLHKILNQEYPEFEVVVVDDNSDDGTNEYLRDLKEKHNNLLVYKFDQPKISYGKKEVLEFGIQQATSEYLVLTDADCYPKSEKWLLSMADGFENDHEIIFGIGQYEQEDTFINRIIQMDTGFIAMNYLSFALVNTPYMSVGRNVGYKKNLFKKVGGFKAHYHLSSGDDDLFVNELPKETKTAIIIDSKSQTVSVPKQSFKGFFNQKTRHVSAGMHYRWGNLLILSVFYSSSMLWYLMLPFVLYFTKLFFLVLTIAVLKKLTMYSLIRRIFSKIDVRANYWMILLAEFISVFIHNIAVLVTLFKSKKGTW